MKGFGVEKCISALQNAKDVCRRLHVAEGAQDPMQSIDASVADLGDIAHGIEHVDASNLGSASATTSSQSLTSKT